LEKAVCILSVVALRKDASDASEMVSQVLFGEVFSIYQHLGSWCYVELDFDGYKGWIDSKALTILNAIEIEQMQKYEPYLIDKPFCLVQHLNSKSLVVLPMGSAIYNLEGSLFSLAGNSYSFEMVTDKKPKLNPRQIIINSVHLLLNAPYLWGGRTVMGIDCSGLVQLACKIAEIPLKRDASQQAEYGETVNFIEKAIPGDILFFDNAEGRIIHTGILLPENKIIHASGSVRIDSIDHQGIYNHDRKLYTHKLRLIKRIV
jgi:hypothetical protein